jgi:hypothetical protein
MIAAASNPLAGVLVNGQQQPGRPVQGVEDIESGAAPRSQPKGRFRVQKREAVLDTLDGVTIGIRDESHRRARRLL